MLQRESGVFVSSGSTENSANSDMRYRLDTVTYTSPEFDEMETIVEVPIEEDELRAAEKPQEAEGPEAVICVSPEFDEIETLI